MPLILSKVAFKCILQSHHKREIRCVNGRRSTSPFLFRLCSLRSWEFSVCSGQLHFVVSIWKFDLKVTWAAFRLLVEFTGWMRLVAGIQIPVDRLSEERGHSCHFTILAPLLPHCCCKCSSVQCQDTPPAAWPYGAGGKRWSSQKSLGSCWCLSLQPDSGGCMWHSTRLWAACWPGAQPSALPLCCLMVYRDT